MSVKNTGLSSSGLLALEQFLPEGTLSLLQPLLEQYAVIIKIKPPRKSKFGDYRPLRNSKRDHQITLNNDLNPFSFLVTLLHEMAHMYAYAEHGGKPKPHGKEWQVHYSKLLHAFMEAEVFPTDLHLGIEHHLSGPTASSCTDHHLYRILRQYDERKSSLVLLESLSSGEHFRWRNGQIFRKAEKMRKRYRCLELKTKRLWFFHPMAEVEKL